MINIVSGIVKEIIYNSEKLQELLIVADNNKEFVAYNFPEFNDTVEVGERLILNHTANYLNLGSGGYDYVIFREKFFAKDFIDKFNTRINHKGHIMKLRYTPLQFAALSIEEQEKFHEIFNKEHNLTNTPIIIGELHSMLPISVALLKYYEEKYRLNHIKISYIMTDTASLTSVISKHLRILKKLNWINSVITYGNAFGGDYEAVNIYSALITAKFIDKADVIIVTQGIGTVGTKTLWGNTGIEMVNIIHATHILNGEPYYLLRVSLSDARKNHFGLSHHSEFLLNRLLLISLNLYYPESREENDYHQIVLNRINNRHNLIRVEGINIGEIKEALSRYPLVITSMGRTIENDQHYFAFIAATIKKIIERIL